MNLTFEETQELVTILRGKAKAILDDPFESVTYFGIPRGGLMVAALLRDHHADTISSIRELSRIDGACFLVDDIVMTGKTALFHIADHSAPFKAVLTLFDKRAQDGNIGGVRVLSAAGTRDWVTFPWEVNESGPVDAVRRLIEYAGDDPTRDGVKDTPVRVLRFLDEIREDRSFNETGFETSYDDLVVVRNIHFASLCEHHMLPYFGTVAVGYIPDGKIIGLSKVARIVFQESGGLTIQEELSRKIAEHVKESTGSEDVGVVTQATHSCMVVRGPRALGSDTFASSMLGKFRDEQELRAEFYSIVRDLR